MTYKDVLYMWEVIQGHLDPSRASSGQLVTFSQWVGELGEKSQFCHPEKFFMDRRAETFIIIIIGPKMVFWPNFSQIRGYVFSKNGHLSIPIFGRF